MMQRAREGDMVETVEGLIFDVKGFVHPPDKIVAYLRYVESPNGDRRKGEKTYIKVYSISEREEILKEKYPEYLCYDPVFGDRMQEVPNRRVSKIYKPQNKVSNLLKEPRLDRIERDAIEFICLLHDLSNVDLGKIGVSGSILVDLYKEDSDIDVIVYGKKNCLAIHATLKEEMKRRNSPIRRYDLEGLKKLYEFRSKDTWMPLKDFIRMERRKFMQGTFRGRDFFMRFIPDWNEVNERYGDRIYVPSGYVKIKARIADDSESIFTPCRYLIEDVRILDGVKVRGLKEIVSFRGRFCEQARKDEIVVAQGKLEKVIEKNGTEFFRLILGVKPSDFMLSRES